MLFWFVHVKVDTAVTDSPNGTCEPINTALNTKRKGPDRHIHKYPETSKVPIIALRGRHKHTRGYLLRRRRRRLKKLSWTFCLQHQSDRQHSPGHYKYTWTYLPVGPSLLHTNIVLGPATVSDCNFALFEVEIAVAQWLMGNTVTTVQYFPHVCPDFDIYL